MNIYNQLKHLAGQHEIFLFEAPSNKYQPAPQEGWFGMRSSKRRVFMRLDNGKMPTPDVVQSRLAVGEFVEHQLTNP